MTVPWWRKAKRKRKRPPVPRKPVLYIEEILRWADGWKARTGDWPGVASGRIPESPGDRWCHIHDALRHGLRGLQPGSTLFKLLAKRRGAVHRKTRFSRFEISTILAWADAHHRRTGDWPHLRSGPIARVPGETWTAVNAALVHGHRGLPGGSSLARLLGRERGRAFRQRLPALAIESVLSWADAHFQRKGAWPTEGSGVVHEGAGETWLAVRQALNKGHRGLPGGSSLHQFLVAYGRIKSPPARGLRRLRVRAGLSRRRLAEQLRVAVGTVQGWEIGRRLPMPTTLAALAIVLGLPAGQLRAEMEAVQRGWRKKQLEKREVCHTGKEKGTSSIVSPGVVSRRRETTRVQRL